MTSLPKRMAKFGYPRNQTKYISFESYPKINLSHCVKSYRHFCQILTLFTMPAHQIWSCHMTQDANFRRYQQKTSPDGGKAAPINLIHGIGSCIG